MRQDLTTKTMKEKYPRGTRVELIEMNDPHTKIEPGTQGTVQLVDDTGTVHVKWDNGSRLGLVPGEDKWKRI
jgi:hypothetical protein